MKNLFIIICFIFITSCNSAKKTSENKTVIDASTEISSTKTAPIQAMVEAFSKINNDAGVILLKQSNGKSSIYSAGYANTETKEKVNENYLFEIGSASKLLIENNLSISQICYESGFNHLSNFNRQFKKIKNMTPSEYQRKFWSKNLDQINDY